MQILDKNLRPIISRRMMEQLHQAVGQNNGRMRLNAAPFEEVDVEKIYRE